MITHKFKLIPLNILGETLPCNHGLLSKLFFQPSTSLPHPLNLNGSLVYELSKESCPQFN